MGAKVRFWVIELGGDAKATQASTQRLKLALQPRLATGGRPWWRGTRRPESGRADAGLGRRPGIDPERVAEVLVTPAGRVDQRRHVLAGERWLDALEPLGRLDPGALAAIDRELHAGRR